MISYILKQYITEILQIAVAVGVGCLAGFFAVYVFNRLPAIWLCDYDEEPPEELFDKRIKETPWIIIFSVFFMLVTFRMITVYLAPYTLLDYFQMVLHICAIWVMVQIAIADFKYKIIPDQFILTVAIIGLFLEHSVLGAALGAGIFVILGLAGKLWLKRDDLMGYGDIKLAAAIGFAVGTGYLVLILTGTALVGTVVFITGYLRKKHSLYELQPIGHYMVFFTIIVMLS